MQSLKTNWTDIFHITKSTQCSNGDQSSPSMVTTSEVSNTGYLDKFHQSIYMTLRMCVMCWCVFSYRHTKLWASQSLSPYQTLGGGGDGTDGTLRGNRSPWHAFTPMLTVTLTDRSLWPIRTMHMTVREVTKIQQLDANSNIKETRWKTWQSKNIKIDRIHKDIVTNINGQNSL